MAIVLKTIKVRFQTENCVLPRDMAKVLVSFLKGSVKLTEPGKYLEWWASGNVVKSFCWSAYYPSASVHDEIIELGQNWFLVSISTPIDEDFRLLVKALRKRVAEKISINRNSITITSVRIYNEVPVCDSSILVKSESPVVIRGKDKLFLTERDGAFTEALNTSIASLLLHFAVSGEVFIEPIRTKAVTVSAFGPATGNVGYFKVTGDETALNFILASGIGAKRSEGFGRLKVVEREPR